MKFAPVWKGKALGLKKTNINGCFVHSLRLKVVKSLFLMQILDI